MPHLLLYGNSYAPEHTGIGPYSADIAEHMASRGWRVTVVSGMPHYPQWHVEAPYRGRLRLREERNGVDVRRVWQFVPARQSAAGRALYEGTFFAHAVTLASPARPDCVVGVVPSLAGGAAAAVAARRHRVCLGLVVQDIVGRAAAQSGIPGGSLAARPASAVERTVLRHAEKVAVITESFRPYLEDAGVPADRVVHLPNWTHVEPPTAVASDTRSRLGWRDGETVVLHAGNMGYKQNLAGVIEAAKVAQQQRLPLRFVLMGDGNDRSRLEALAHGMPNVDFLDPEPDGSFMDVLAAADILLLHERASVVDMSLPSKITSYFRTGRPVVAAIPPGGATDAELVRSGGASVVPAEDPQALVTALTTVAADPCVAERLVRSALDHANRHFDRPTLLARAEAFIEDLAGRSPSPIRGTKRSGPP